MARWGSAAAALAVLSIFLLLGPSSSVGRSEADARSVYRAWIARHSHALGSDIDFDDERRFKAFRDNLDFIDEHNARAGVGYRLGTTAYAHLTNDEFRAAYAVGKGQEAYGDIGATVDDTPLPDHVDWRTSGAVAPVKSQGQCGSCCAFAAIAAVESATKIANNASDIITMSEQQIVDCVRNGRSKGCQYGFVTEALDFIAAHGACPDSEYPYTGSDTDTCRNCYIAVGGMAGFESVPGNNESALLIAVARQPMIVFIESSGREFQLYESGVFSGPCGTAMDHFVVAVGYGTTDDGKPFWLVRNSWGDGWGESGYVRMERSSGTVGAGLCGIATAPMYPVVHVK